MFDEFAFATNKIILFSETGPSRDSRLESSASMHKEIEGVLGKLSDVSVYDNPVSEDIPCEESKGTEPVCRQGTSGQR